MRLELRPGRELVARQVLQRPAAAVVGGRLAADVAAGDELVHRPGRPASGCDGLDHRCRAGDAVAAGEDLRFRGLHGRAVDVDVAPVVQPHRQVVVEELGVGALADRPDDQRGRQLEVAALDRDRPAAPGAVRLAEGHLQAAERRARRGRAGSPWGRRGSAARHPRPRASATSCGLRRHLVAGAAVQQHDALGAATQRRAGAVDGGVAAADDDNDAARVGIASPLVTCSR